MTRSFYDENADVYASRNRKLPTARLDAFLSALPSGARILELGCGGGHDSAYMLSKGFDVMATAKQAEKLIGKPVKVMRFEELEAKNEFDGVWAEASLLHVPRKDLPAVLARIRRALKDGGALHASFKAGTAEGHDGFGRYYNYISAANLSELLMAGGWRNITIDEADGSGYDEKPTRWLHLRAQ
ncbi:class I SAM-dependent methyltransferase [Rhizobium mongolense]|uniref:SAM-dependent methyltransferase n=2 Tax=Rhizobium mongolense TaxID=57676 RepID=A0ABR6IM43_9HYPH|nr:class I SAM-dependent methyltransferase [Rhizobium mongolense]MBB4228953.1 SAM-dependent methyltransferase [Rhizobium mongolense]TVZ63486.1 methyltransferase family protein [Rhizobium mongolense USDA 1844]